MKELMKTTLTLQRTLFKSLAGPVSRRAGLTLLIFTCVLLPSAWFTLPEAAGRAANSPPQSGAVKSQSELKSGLQRIIFTTPLGSKIFANFPEDMRRSETCSGSIFGEASGKTDAQRAASRNELVSYSIEIAGQRIPVTQAGKTFQLKIPTSTGSELDKFRRIVLRDQKGEEIARSDFAVASQAASAATSFRLPTVQLGEIIEVDCPCDGVITDSDFNKVDGVKSLLLAESPRKRMAFNTSPRIGATEIEVQEGGQARRGSINILGIKLTALKTQLLKGEHTVLTVEVSGLDGVKEPVPLLLENKTTTVLTMEPSNVQQLSIQPADVQPGGKYTTQRTLTGIQVGDFFIEGTVVRGGSLVTTDRTDTATSQITGRVLNNKGRPVSNVDVLLDGKVKVRSRNDGFFSVQLAGNESRVALTFRAEGYVSNTRVYDSKATGINSVVIWPIAHQVTFDPVREFDVKFGSSRIQIPANALTGPAGEKFKGRAKLSFTLFDVTDRLQRAGASGDFSGQLLDGSIRRLNSYGIFDLGLNDLKGRPLTIADGAKIDLAIAVPPKLKTRAPKQIGFFDFDELTGRWIQTTNFAFAPSTLTYNGSVNRLGGVHNLDDPQDTTCITVRVVYGGYTPAVMPNFHVTAYGEQYNSDGTTDANGFVCLLVQRNSTFTVDAQGMVGQSSYGTPDPPTFTSPNFGSGTADCGNSSTCPFLGTVTVDLIVGGDH